MQSDEEFEEMMPSSTAGQKAAPRLRSDSDWEATGLAHSEANGDIREAGWQSLGNTEDLAIKTSELSGGREAGQGLQNILRLNKEWRSGNGLRVARSKEGIHSFLKERRGAHL